MNYQTGDSVGSDGIINWIITVRSSLRAVNGLDTCQNRKFLPLCSCVEVWLPS